MHESIPVGPGETKYIIRSDVMYEREPRRLDGPKDKEAFKLIREAEELAGAGSVDEAQRMFRKARRLSPELAAVYGM